MLSKYILSLAAAAAMAGFTMAQSHIPISGVSVTPETGTIPVRQNINDLQNKGGAQWDLYLQAITAMMYKMDPNDPQSFFQVAGIHGQPFIEWDNGGTRQADGWAGYCPHGEKLFLPWHRPYVLLFEQNLVRHAQEIANTYPQKHRAEYQQAAATLRAPFWDWAAQSYVPAATVPKTMKVNVPNGEDLKQVDIDNPLFTFKFPEAALNGTYGSFPQQPQMNRCPAPKSYPASANENLSKRPYRQWVYDAFTHADGFNSFASTGDKGISLEQIHNGIHWDAGCGGQFLDASTSAFDPIFMMHHCQVDRLWAYWEAIHTNETIFTDSYPGLSRWATHSGTIITNQSPLEPFYGANGKVHTSETVQSIKGMGYTYDQLEYWKKTDEQMGADATTLINKLYANPAPAPKVKRSGGSQPKTRYFIDISVDVQELERPCSVDVKVGGQSAGSLIVMKQPESGTFHGAFSIDEPLQSKAFHGLSVKSTMESIQDALEVEIVKANGECIPLKSVPSLKIDLENVEVTPNANEDCFPIFGKSESQPAKLLTLDLLGIKISI